MKRVALLFALVVAGCNGSAPANDSRQSVDPVPQVDVVQVVSQKLEATERLPAELAPWEQVAIYPKVQGFVEEIPVDRGSVVRRGQLLVRLSAPELGPHCRATKPLSIACRLRRVRRERSLATSLNWLGRCLRPTSRKLILCRH